MNSGNQRARTLSGVANWVHKFKKKKKNRGRRGRTDKTDLELYGRMQRRKQRAEDKQEMEWI